MLLGVGPAWSCEVAVGWSRRGAFRAGEPFAPGRNGTLFLLRSEVLVEGRGMRARLAPLATVGTVRRDGQEHAAGAAAMIRRAPPRPAARLVVGGRG
jgi:hypothetical protein